MAGGTGARPMGITVIAILAFIGGIFLVFAGLAALGFGALFAAATGLGGLLIPFGIVSLTLGVANLALGYGFWTLVAWAWRLGVILALVDVVWSLVNVPFGGGLTNLIFTIAVSAAWLYYLNWPEIRRAFGAPETGLPVVGRALDPALASIGKVLDPVFRKS